MAYIGVSPSNGVRRVHTYTATASQTTFSGAGAEGTSLSYKDSNFVDVYQNGIKLGDADYTSTSGTSIVLAQGASVDDLVVVVVFDVFSVADTVSKADGGTFDGNVTMGGTLGVTGASTLTGALSAKGGAVFNEDSADVDFRVESNDDANILRIEGATNNVKIGSNAGDYAQLSIKNEKAGAQERGLYVECTPASGTSPNNVAVFSATNANLTTPVVRIHHESPAADGKLLTCTVTGSNTETFYLDEDGDAYFKGNVGIGAAPFSNGQLAVEEQSSGTIVAQFKNNAGSSPYGVSLDFSSAAPDDNSHYFIRMEDSSTDRCFVYSDGDIYNHDGTYAQISDERIKDNITNANSQWDDIKGIRFVNYQRKDDIRQYGKDKAKVQLGVIGQELEKVSPNLVRKIEPNKSDILSSSEFGTLYTSDDAETKDGNDAVLYTKDDIEVELGQAKVGDVKTRATHSKEVGDVKETKDKVKGVAYSILYMKAVKALQEAMTRIEILETENKTQATQIADLISRITALEKGE